MTFHQSREKISGMKEINARWGIQSKFYKKVDSKKKLTCQLNTYIFAKLFSISSVKH